MAVKNSDNSQYAIVHASGQQAGLLEGHGSYPTLDADGRLVVVGPTNGFMLTGSLALYKRTNNFYAVLANGPLYLFKAWGMIDPFGLVQNYAHFYDTVDDPPSPFGGPYIPAIPVQAHGGMWSIEFAEGLRFTTGLGIGYSQTWNAWLQAAVGGAFAALVKFP